MKTIHFIFLIFIFIIALSCKDDDAEKEPVVYATGFEYTSGNNSVAKYWKNGVATILSDGSKDASTSAIFISGDDVYVAGVEDNSAKYWKNGESVNLPGGQYATSIFVSGEDVYVSGYDDNVLVYWKNGNRIVFREGTNLPDGSIQSAANSITVSGTDLYIAGFDEFKACYWKNGQRVLLSDVTSSVGSYIMTDGSDVYVAGDEILVTPTASSDIAVYWKNGTKVSVSSTDGTQNASASAMALSNSNVFVCGSVYSFNSSKYRAAYYWKDGVVTALTDGSTISYANAIYVHEGIAYVGGSERTANNATSVAKIWKDGVATSLTDGSAFATVTGIVVK